MPLTDDVVVRRRVSRQAEASARRRNEILDGAVTAFIEKGFNGTSIREIASRAGLSHTGVLHHFPDKNAILEAVLDRRNARITDQIHLDPHDGLRFLRDLVTLAEEDVQDVQEMRMYRIVAAEALAPNHPAHGYQRRWYAQVREWVAIALRDLESKGLYAGAADIETASFEIAGLRDGLDPQWLLDPDRVDLVSAFRAQLGSYVVGGI